MQLCFFPSLVRIHVHSSDVRSSERLGSTDGRLFFRETETDISTNLGSSLVIVEYAGMGQWLRFNHTAIVEEVVSPPLVHTVVRVRSGPTRHLVDSDGPNSVTPLLGSPQADVRIHPPRSTLTCAAAHSFVEISRRGNLTRYRPWKQCGRFYFQAPQPLPWVSDSGENGG